MEEWWRNNEQIILDSGMTFVGHACITTVTIHEDAGDRLRQRHDQSYQAVCQLIEEYLQKVVHRPKTIVIFGETGAGKSSLINLMAGKEIAHTSPDMQRCTLRWDEYDMNFDGNSYTVFDTIGLEEPQLGIKEYLDSVENAYNLIKELDKKGGIDLLLFCVRAGKVTATLQSNYRLFHEFLCEKKVPIVLAITNLEREQIMEDWWKRNQATFKKYQIEVAGHACITAANRLDGRHRDLYEESRVTIRKLVEEFTGDEEKQAWIGGDNLFTSLMRKLRVFLSGGPNVKKKNLVSHLTKRCNISSDAAKRLAEMIRQDVG
jgi:predicted GTPase